MDNSLSTRLAAWLAEIEWRSLPQRQQELARLRLLDTLGLLLGGFDSEASAIARDRASQEGAGRSSVVGSLVGVPAGWAAFANGITAHCLDFDDTFPDSMVHPGSVIIPVSLAVGDEVNAPGAEILTAIAVGYEIAARLARAGGKRFHERGFHASGIFAPIAAAYVAGRLMRLPPAAIAAAAGLAASMSGGLMAFLSDGTWSKWLHLGWGGLAGILATQLAAGGFRGPLGALDGRHNLYAAFLGDASVDRDSVEASLGQEWHNETALFKLYPCAHVIQPYIDIALELRSSLSLDPSAVKRILCTVAPWAVSIVCEPAAEKVEPQTMLQAIASLPFNVAAALIDGDVNLETLTAASLKRPDIRALARRVAYVVDPDLQGFEARLAIELSEGRSRGRADRPAEPNADHLLKKFRLLAARALPEEQVARLVDAVTQFPEATNAQAIGALLRGASSQKQERKARPR